MSDTERFPLPNPPPARGGSLEPELVELEPVADHESRLIALVIAVGLALAVNVITLAVLWDAVQDQGDGLTSNATQVLALAFGGMIGILGSVLGYRAGARASLER